MLITRVFKFAAAHRYHDPALSDEENQRLFGACNNPYGHGHNYTLEVSVGGEVDPSTGMIINLKDLKTIVETHVIAAYDHRFLNYEVDDFQGTQPTTEQIALAIWRRLDGKFPSGHLARIRLWENDELFADVTA